MGAILKYGLVYLILFTTHAAGAANSCQQVFRKAQVQEADYSAEEALVNEMLMVQRELNHARTLTDANNGIHALVVQANKVFDVAVQYIVQINFTNAPTALKKRNAYAAERLIEIIQQTMGLDNQNMQMAVQRRVNLEVEYIQQMQEAQAQRRAIGFTRNESAESFHREDGQHRQQIGFVLRRETEADRVPPEKLESIGFRMPESETTVERSIRELVEFFEQLREPAEQQHFGFAPLKESKEGSSESQPIGFMRFKAESDVIDPNLLHQIVFDMQYGTFNFQRAQQ